MSCSSILTNIGATKFNNDSILGRDNLVYTIIGSVISSLGLLNNNVVPIIGSMVVSPVLGPFYLAMARTIGGQIGGKGQVGGNAWTHAITHHLLLMCICLIIGFICGIVNYHFKFYEPESDEMRARSQYKHLVADIIIALVCGFGIAFAILRNDIIVQVGFAISITVLPAIVTGGLYLALAYIKWRTGIVNTTMNSNNDHNINTDNGMTCQDYLFNAWNTIVLTFVNVILVVLTSIIVFAMYC